jgi:hypothetical protein
MTHERKLKMESTINECLNLIEKIRIMDAETFSRIYSYRTKDEVLTRKAGFIDGFCYALADMGFHLKWKGTAHGGYEIVRTRRKGE